MAKDKAKNKEAPEGEAAEAVEGEEGAPAKKKLPVLFIAIGVAVALVLGGGGTAAFLIFGKKKPPEAHGEKKPEKKEEKKKEGKEGEGAKPVGIVKEGPDGVTFYTMPDITVNMQSPDNRPTYIKLKLTLELPNAELVDVLEPNMPRMQDMFQSFLRELRPEDMQGSQGNYQLRMEIQRRVNLIIAPAKVNAVLIEEMLIS
ncbi:MAG: flagellar basal body-associated protein FliL [Pseudomonadota bacterium]|jgi:flagellar FliL protein